MAFGLLAFQNARTEKISNMRLAPVTFDACSVFRVSTPQGEGHLTMRQPGSSHGELFAPSVYT
eukprot:7438582-Pyramimonas_sp.AAC.2